MLSAGAVSPVNLPPTQSGGPTAFVGGFFDRTIGGPAFRAYENAGGNYFTWDQGRDLASWIDANGGNVSVIGHSYGASTAASVVAQGHQVASLLTIDPVSWFRPNYAAVKANAGTWVNLNAVGGQGSIPNIIAGIGGAWNNGPAAFAHHHRNVPMGHATIMSQCWAAPRSC